MVIVSRWYLSADCNLHRTSSIVFNIAPILPQHPKPKGKITNHFRLFLMDPNQPQRVCASKVSVSSVLRLTNVSRYNFDAATSMPGFNDPTGMYRRVSGWLGGTHVFQVSRFDVLLPLADTDALNLELSRCDLDPTVSPSPPNESNDSIRTF